MTAAFMSELWTRPEAHHIHASNHTRGRAMDVSSAYRSYATQRALYDNWIAGTNWSRVLLREYPLLASWLVRPAPPAARVVAWGGRKGDIQVGSIEDRKRQRWLKVNAAAARIMRAHPLRIRVTSAALAALVDMGREFDAIWAT